MAIVLIINVLDSWLILLCPRQRLGDECVELFMACGCASLAGLALEAENPVLRDLWQPRVLEHAVIVPFDSILRIKFVVLIAVREDQDRVQGFKVLDRSLADAQNGLLSHGWPSPALEQHDSQSKWLRLRILVKPSHPVGGGNARVVQARGVNQVKVSQLFARRLLSDSLDFPCGVEHAILPSQPVQHRRLAVTDGSQHHHSWFCRVR